jgi:phage-related protein
VIAGCLLHTADCLMAAATYGCLTMTAPAGVINSSVDTVAAVIQAALDAVALVIEMIFYVISTTVQSGLDPVAFFIQMVFNAIAFTIQMLCQVCFARRSSFFSQGIKAIVDPVTFGIKVVVDPIAPGVQTVIDPITTPVQPMIDPIAEPIIKTILGESRCHTPQSQDAESNYHCLFHRCDPPL